LAGDPSARMGIKNPEVVEKFGGTTVNDNVDKFLIYAKNMT
jgi:hypothetical protein